MFLSRDYFLLSVQFKLLQYGLNFNKKYKIEFLQVVSKIQRGLALWCYTYIHKKNLGSQDKKNNQKIYFYLALLALCVVWLRLCCWPKQQQFAA